jgi:hypothetical protein
MIKKLICRNGVVLPILSALLLGASASGQSSLMTSGSSTRAAGNTQAAKAASIPPVHPFSTTIRDGILTVDGLVGKAQMNYDVHQAFLYFTVPGIGTAIVAQSRFMNALPQKDAFHGDTLTLQLNGHTIELSNAGPIASGRASEAWVSFDPLYGADIAFPQMGYGNTIQRPYVWPGSKAEKTNSNAYVQAPPLPPSLRPKPEIASSYTVTVPPTAEPVASTDKR